MEQSGSGKNGQAAGVLPEWRGHAGAGKIPEKRKAGRRGRKRDPEQYTDDPFREKQAWGRGKISGEHIAQRIRAGEKDSIFQRANLGIIKSVHLYKKSRDKSALKSTTACIKKKKVIEYRYKSTIII